MEADYGAFEEILVEAVERTEMRLLAYCVLPNHWHLVVWPREDGDLSRFTHLADADAHAKVARPAGQHGERPRLPGAVQILPRAGR